MRNPQAQDEAVPRAPRHEQSVVVTRARAVLLAIGGTLAISAGCAKDARPTADTSIAHVVPVTKESGAPPRDAGAAARPASSTGNTVLFLGTSLTAGLGLEPDSAYPQRIQRKLDASGLSFQAVNAGVSGETSAGLLQRLDWVLQQPASVIVVETGANDGLRGQPVEGTKATIGKVLDRIARERPEAKVVLVQMEAPTNMGRDYTVAFHSMFPALAAEHHVTLMPFLLDRVAGIPSLNQADGVHPNDAGERIVTENVWRALEPVLRSLPAHAR